MRNIPVSCVARLDLNDSGAIGSAFSGGMVIKGKWFDARAEQPDIGARAPLAFGDVLEIPDNAALRATIPG